MQGVSVRRSENASNYDYRLIRDLEEKGIRQYVHKYFEGYGQYYQLLAQEKLIEEIEAIGQKLDGKAKKWNPAF